MARSKLRAKGRIEIPVLDPGQFKWCHLADGLDDPATVTAIYRKSAPTWTNEIISAAVAGRKVKPGDFEKWTATYGAARRQKAMVN